jgi:ribosomal protein S15P/S13E
MLFLYFRCLRLVVNNVRALLEYYSDFKDNTYTCICKVFY